MVDAGEQAGETVRDRAEEVRHQVEAAVRDAGQVSAAVEALRDSNDREIFSISKGPGDSIVLRTSFRERVITGGGLSYDDADVLLCVQYTVEPDGDTTIADTDCPEEMLTESGRNGRLAHTNPASMTADERA